MKTMATILVTIIVSISVFAAGNTGKKDVYSIKYASPSMPRLSGTFIQPWMVSGWTDTEWEMELDTWQQLGIRYVILGDLVNYVSSYKNEIHVFCNPAKAKDSTGRDILDNYNHNVYDFMTGDTSSVISTQDTRNVNCRYRSTVTFQEDILEKVLSKCASRGMKVIIGFGCEAQWYEYVAPRCSVNAASVRAGKAKAGERIDNPGLDGTLRDGSTCSNRNFCINGAQASGTDLEEILNSLNSGFETFARFRVEVCARIMQDCVNLYKTRYPDALYGWYWGEELYNDVLWRNDTVREAYARNMARVFAATIKAIENIKHPSSITAKQARMPLYFSPHVNPNAQGPYSGYACTDAGKCTDFWRKLVANARFRNFDVLIPQSSVDYASCSLEGPVSPSDSGNPYTGRTDDISLATWTKIYKDGIDRAVAQEGVARLVLGINIEGFLGNEYTVTGSIDGSHAMSKDIARFARGLEILSNTGAGNYYKVPLVDKAQIFCFAYTYHLSPASVIGGYHSSLIHYFETGRVEKNPPVGPTKIRTKLTTDGLMLSFSGHRDDYGIGRINIYKNGKCVDYLTNISTTRGNAYLGLSAPDSWVDKNFNPSDEETVYEVEAVDVSGNRGRKIPVSVRRTATNNGVILDANHVYKYNPANPMATAGMSSP